MAKAAAIKIAAVLLDRCVGVFSIIKFYIRLF